MCRKLFVILLLCVAMFMPSIATAQSLSVFAKQKVAIAGIIDKNDRHLSDAIKTVIQNGIRDAFVNSNDYEVFNINTDEIGAQLKAKGVEASFANICAKVGQRADFIVFTEILTSSSAFGVQNVEIIITSSLYRIATGSKILADQVRTQPTEQSIRAGTAQLIHKLFGVKMSGQAEHSATPTSYNQTQSSNETLDEIVKKALDLYNEKRYEEAVPYLRKAAEQKQPHAQYWLGRCYANGKGVSKDDYEALKWYRKAAEQGYDKAQTNLGLRYATGKGVSQDYYEAAEWFRKAAEQGYASAQYSLGFSYEKGQGVSQDYYKAAEWYLKAAEQGHKKAQNNLGLYYEKGRGVSQDYYEAVKWYRKAAEQGHSTSQYNLGRCYEKGQGVDVDIDTARYWYRKAADQNCEPAQKALGRLGY